ncbi:MAG TPA: SIR2 family protein, partial [Pseudomonadales bacterium]|nr:SIR2 family protein [Pseudomonadales bacterium]
MDTALRQKLISGIKDGSIVPYLGAGALQGSVSVNGGDPIPADSDSLIHAMNNGSPMAPKLMYEFPRAAMNLELK